MTTAVLLAIVGPVAMLVAFGLGMLVGRPFQTDGRSAVRCPICLTEYGTESARDTCHEACRREAARKA